MAKSIDFTETWADDVYTFRLNLPQLEEHDDKCGAGPIAVLGALVDGTWRLPYVRETIRLGLIGGGLAPVAAFKLVSRYVDNRPLIESLPFAIAILGAAVRGNDVEEDEPGKTEAAKPASETAAEAGSTSPPSDEALASSG